MYLLLIQWIQEKVIYIVTLSVTKCNNKRLRYLIASLVYIKLGYDQLHGQSRKLTINILYRSKEICALQILITKGCFVLLIIVCCLQNSQMELQKKKMIKISDMLSMELD